MKLFIGTIFAHSSRNSEWYNLQKSFIEKTTKSYEYGIFLANDVNKKPFDSIDIIGKSKSEHSSTISHDHALNLHCLIELFKKMDFDYYLILDSDCFPIRKNWFDILLKEMET